LDAGIAACLPASQLSAQHHHACHNHTKSHHFSHVAPGTGFKGQQGSQGCKGLGWLCNLKAFFLHFWTAVFERMFSCWLHSGRVWLKMQPACMENHRKTAT
jgi:hypothetical protein